MDLNFTQMYLTSPDWLKLLWTVLPHMTTWIVASILVFGGKGPNRPARTVEANPERRDSQTRDT